MIQDPHLTDTSSINCASCGKALVRRPVAHTRTVYLYCPVCDTNPDQLAAGGAAPDQVEKASETDRDGFDLLEKAA